MKKYILLFGFGLLFYVPNYAQEGSFGGDGSGDVINCYAQLDPSLDSMYNGGVDDGFVMACLVQSNSPINNFYYGGIDDGFAIGCYAQLDLSLDSMYNGGVDDGFVIACYTQLSSITNGMYSGVSGVAAGFSFSCAGSLNNEVPLPIELLSFDAILNGDKVDLLWSTITEINNDFFIVEKTIDMINFEEVALVNGAGNSNGFISYSEIDENPYNGISYYRLKQTDFDGNYSYSNLVPIRYVKKGMQIEIYPNPVDGNVFYLSINGNQGEKLNVIIYDALGKAIFTTSFIQQQGTFLKMIDVSKDLVPGMYFVVVESKDNIFKQKLIVK